LIFSSFKEPFKIDDVVEQGGERFLEEFRNLTFLLSLYGQIIVPYQKENNIFIDVEKKEIRATVNQVHQVIVKYDNLILFTDENVFGLYPYKEEQKNGNLIIDWIDLNYRNGKRINFNKFNREQKKFDFYYDSNFVKRIYFYICSKKRGVVFRNAIAVSFLSDEELKDFDFSESIVRMKVDELVNKKLKIKTNIGYNVSKVTGERIPSYYPVYLDHVKREVFCLDKRIYENKNGLIFKNVENETFLELINNFWYTRHYIKFVLNKGRNNKYMKNRRFFPFKKKNGK
jgi:hypothetical protein